MSKFQFDTLYSDRERIPSKTGKPVRPQYSAYYDKNGTLELEVVGEENIYEQIQSHRDSVDIHLLLKRFTQTGDSSLFQRAQGFYGDYSEMPKTYQEVLNMDIQTRQFFDLLPVSIKNVYNDSYSEFLVHLGDESQMKLLADYFGKEVVPSNPVHDDPVVEEGGSVE